MIRRRLLKIGVFGALGLLSAPGALADHQNMVLLTINMCPESGNEPLVHELKYADLAALPVTEFSTTTNWTTGQQVFSGVRLRDLLDHISVTSGTLELRAINDYSALMSIDDPTLDGALIAYRLNGELMYTRDKGPLWLVYDYDSDAAFRTDTVFARSIWQLDRIVISR